MPRLSLPRRIAFSRSHLLRAACVVVGIVLVTATQLGCVQEQAAAPVAAEPTTPEVEDEVTEVVFTEPTTLVFTVPEMMCPHGCYPAVKEALAAQTGVESIALGTPEEEKANTITDRRVIVTTDGAFNASAAVAQFPAHLQEGVEVEASVTASSNDDESENSEES